MRIEPFHLERYFADHEFDTPILLGVSDCETTTVGDLLDLDPAARASFEGMRLGYTHSDGSPELREAIAASYGDSIGTDDVLVHAAGVEVVTTLMLAVLGPGDRALVQMPCYQVLRTAPTLAGAAVDRLETAPEERWRVRAEAVAAALRPETRLVVLNSPHNPTGMVIDPDELSSIAELCAGRGIVLFVDEAYRGTRLDGPIDETSAAELGPHVVTLGLVSKGYGLPGLRLGWLVCRDRELRTAVERVKDYTTICAPAPSEFLAELAIRHRTTILARTRRRLRQNLGLLAKLLAEHTDLFDWVCPEAGPITFPTLTADAVERLHRLPGGSADRTPSAEAARPEDAAAIFADRLRAEAGVLVVPGGLFDARVPGIRVGYGRATFPAGLERFAEWLDEAFG